MNRRVAPPRPGTCQCTTTAAHWGSWCTVCNRPVAGAVTRPIPLVVPPGETTLRDQVPLVSARVAETRANRSFAWGLVAGMAIVTLLAGGYIAATDRALPPCATEDSTGCYWDGDTMGNGIGRDLVTP